MICRLSHQVYMYAYDTYLIIPSVNVHSIAAEIANVELLSQKNNSVLNGSKSLDVIFSDRRWF